MYWDENEFVNAGLKCRFVMQVCKCRFQFGFLPYFPFYPTILHPSATHNRLAGFVPKVSPFAAPPNAVTPTAVVPVLASTAAAIHAGWSAPVIFSKFPVAYVAVLSENLSAELP
jgi:hypothetical protein